MFIREFQKQTLWKIHVVAVNAVQCLLKYSVHFKVSGLEYWFTTRCMQTTVTNYCRKHVDSRRLPFSEHHRAKTYNANVFVTVVDHRYLE